VTQRGKSIPARADATQRVIDKYRARPFDWADGATCLHLARAQARAMGHGGLPRIPDLTGPVDALRALKAQGAATLADLLDQHFERLQAPAFALVGDLILFPGDDGRAAPLGALALANGAGCFYGWHDSGHPFGEMVGLSGAAVAGWRL
jgi:hypothetical protein